MRYYEIVCMIYPDYVDQISNIIDRYTEMVVNYGGKVYRVENWGCRQLAYSIKKLRKAYYVLLNIEVSQDVIHELNDDLKFNKAILRNIIIRTNKAISTPSVMMTKKEENHEHSVID